MKTNKKICYIPYDGNELNDIAFSNKYKYRWTNILKEKLEKEGHEIHTYDILPPEEADEILCFDNVYFQNNRFFKRLYKSDKLGNTVHIDYEPPSANCRIHSDKGLKKLSNLFKSLITYNDNVINGKTLVKGCIGDFLSDEKKYKQDFNNRKLVVMVANNRTNIMLFGPHPNELYSKRIEAVGFFQDHCPNDFDLYGNYWPDEYKKCFKKPLSRDEKINVLSKYKFVISYDSICNQRGYISEKIFDCFCAKTVPVYWGADNVEDYIPKECFIDKRNFNTYEELEKFLRNITEEQYNHYIESIEKYLKSDDYKKYFSSKASANVIYNELMKQKRKINKKIALHIINKFEKKRNNDIRYNYSINYYDYNFPSFISLIYYKGINYKKTGINYILIFEIKTNPIYNIELYYKVNNVFKKINAKKIKDRNLNNAYIYTFNFNVSQLKIPSKIELYTFDNKKQAFLKLDINTECNLTDLKKVLKIIVKNDCFIIKNDFRTSVKIILKKFHIFRLTKFIYKFLKLPFVFIKRFFVIFKVTE